MKLLPLQPVPPEGIYRNDPKAFPASMGRVEKQTFSSLRREIAEQRETIKKYEVLIAALASGNKIPIDRVIEQVKKQKQRIQELERVLSLNGKKLPTKTITAIKPA